MEKLVHDTLSITKVVAWLKDFHTNERNYEYCINLGDEVKPFVTNKRHLGILNANLARIHYLRLLREKSRGSFNDVDSDQQKRKAIYGLYIEAIEHKAAKIAYLKAAKLILECGYSPTGNVIRDRETAKWLLDKFLPTNKRNTRGVTSIVPSHSNGNGESKDTENSLPYAGTGGMKEEAIKLWVLLNSSTESTVAPNAPVFPDSLSLSVNSRFSSSMQIENNDNSDGGQQHSKRGNNQPIISEVALVPLPMAPVVNDSIILPPTLPLLQLPVDDGSVVSIVVESESVSVVLPIEVTLLNNAIPPTETILNQQSDMQAENTTHGVNVVPTTVPVSLPLLPTPVITNPIITPPASSSTVDEEDEVFPSPTKRNKKRRIIDDDDSAANFDDESSSDSRGLDSESHKRKSLKKKEGTRGNNDELSEEERQMIRALAARYGCLKK